MNKILKQEKDLDWLKNQNVISEGALISLKDKGYTVIYLYNVRESNRGSTITVTKPVNKSIPTEQLTRFFLLKTKGQIVGDVCEIKM